MHNANEYANKSAENSQNILENSNRGYKYPRFSISHRHNQLNIETV